MTEVGAQELEKFTAGERFAVDPNAVEKELAAVWQAAGQSSEDAHPVTRACLWNVIIHIEERPEQKIRSRLDLSAVVRGLPRYLASRALILKTKPGDNPEIQSWISANCILDGGGGKLVCSEEITLESAGDGWQHLPPLVRALLVPGIPTAVVLTGVPQDEEHVSKSLMQIADRVVTHTAACATPRAFEFARGLKAGRSLLDLGWTSQTELRQSIASMFDKVSSPIAIDRVEGKAAPQFAGDLALAFGWIAACLGAIDITQANVLSKRVHTEHGDIGFSSQIAESQAGIEIAFYSDSSPRSVCIEADGSVVIQDGEDVIRRNGSHIDEAQLLARTLLTPPGGLQYQHALHWARRLYP
ncbi:MAG: glucose-6-phosphate dehydrogenase assembly protein OpcA [Myxococcales bacterium]|nr:glucose-6-phosphate dehydrogenase assembly protein OpcA [Myxococcales bacterium]